MGRWAKPLCSRDQIVLFAPTLQDSVPEDHPVRLFDEVLGELDFGDWERQYVLVDGQPPIHPRVMAAVILYGLSLGIRSSRKLEDSCGNRIDFIWLTEGRVIDHSTLAGFRVRFEAELKGMFRQIGRLAIGLGMANLNQVALDGTVKRSSNSRFAVAKGVTLEQKLAALDQQVEELMKQARQTDRQEDELFGESSPTKLPAELKQIQARQKRLAAALKKVREVEAGQKAKGRLSKDGPAVPTTDPDSSLMKNKSGGFAPNYLVVLATEGSNGLIMDYQVPASGDESSSVIPAVNNLKEAYEPDAAAASEPAAVSGAGETEDEPDPRGIRELLADSNFNTGSNLQQLKQAGIEPWMPAKPATTLPRTTEPPAVESPAVESPAPLELPINPKTKALDKSAFGYDSAADVYRCPGGRTLPFSHHSRAQRQDGPVTYRVYESVDCSGCPLAGRCLSGKNKTRSVRRDEHEPLREEMAARMRTEEGRGKYRRRSFLAETPFAVLNTTMNVRQLLLRGIDKVRTEVGWICIAYNVKKLTTLLAARRQEGARAGG
jgi:transposase